MKLLSQTIVKKFEAKVIPTISERGVGLDANKSYDAIVEVIERVYECQQRGGYISQETTTDMIMVVTTDKGVSGRFGSEFFHPVS